MAHMRIRARGSSQTHMPLCTLCTARTVWAAPSMTMTMTMTMQASPQIGEEILQQAQTLHQHEYGWRMQHHECLR